MNREDIQRERQRLGVELAVLELKCPHVVYEIEKQETTYDWRSEVGYDCFCHDCYKQWMVYEGDKTFQKVKENMTPQTFNMHANEAYIDHGYNFTLADAVDYAEFIEDVNSWEEIVEEMQ